jgi:hypothetical protein
MKQENADVLPFADWLLHRGALVQPMPVLTTKSGQQKIFSFTTQKKETFATTAVIPVTFAADFERPWVTFCTKAWTFPSNSNPETPSVTSLTKPKGLPRKSTDPKMLAACHFSSCEMSSQ